MTKVLACDMKINDPHQIYQFDQVQPSDYALVGKKAFYLSQLQQQDILTTPGIIISSQVLKEFLHTINWEKILGFDVVNSCLNLDIDNYQQLRQVSQKIKQEIIKTDLPLNTICLLQSVLEKWSNTSLLLRPSLYVEHETNEDINIPNKLLKSHISTLSLPYLINTLKETWSELFRAHSLFYFIKTGIDLQQINLAVLIQPMYPCITSGKLEYNENHLKIEAIWGLPNAMSEGQVIPDQYKVNLATKNIEFKKLGHKTIAYRLINPYIGVENNLIHTNNNFLQAYMLSADQQQQYALEEYYINQLMEITKKLQFNLNKKFNFEWVVCLDSDSSEPELYITQINLDNGLKKLPSYAENYAAEKTLYTDNTVNELNLIIKALGAAPGKVVNQAAILLDYRKQYQTIPPHKVLIVKS
ncbi:MAG TPA: PEP/pyruvate-binding domain-containing protein, partial [Allocoleopsis sp.]